MTRSRTYLVAAVCLLVFGWDAAGQTAQTPKAPPLFPKHRRGLYTNSQNVEVIDATPQSPPLATDDPSVPDKGEFEINLLTEADVAVNARRVNIMTADVNYGLVLKGWGHELPTQVKLEIPISAARDGTEPYQVGIGTSAFGLKFNFYNDEDRGLSVSLYPQVEFSTGESVAKGVAEPGPTFELPLLVSHESRYLTLVGNAELTRTFHNETRGTGVELGAAAGRAFFRKLAVMGELRSESALNFRSDRLLSTSVGAIYGVRKAIWYARVGHSLYSDDGKHVLVSVGMKLLIG